MDNRLTVAYVRLSCEDLNKLRGFSESVYNQLDLIKSYVKGIGLKIDNEYIDDGFSGMSFDRPAFEKLVDDIERGIVGVIVTKDMSRLGRDFIETAYYISEYFPKYGVRYIAINDEFDSYASNNNEQQIMLSFKSLINDRYVNDSSIKRKQIAESKTSEGQFIGFIAPYGYKIVEKNNKRTLEIDDYAAGIVKRIFAEIASGKSRKEVADGLNKDKIMPPVQYMKMTPSKHINYHYDWSDGAIYRILRNETYTGKIVKRKSIKRGHFQKKREIVPIRDRETIDNCHPIIITEQLFKEANDRLIVVKRKVKSDYCGLFSGLVICGECGCIMVPCRRSDRANVKYFFNCTKVVDRKSCLNRTITDSKLNTIIVSAVQEVIEDYVDEDEIITLATKNLIKFERSNLKILHLKEAIELCDKNIRKLYLQKTKGEMNIEQFLETKKKETLLKEKLEKLLIKISELKNENIRKQDVLEEYRHFNCAQKLINTALRDLVDKIVVYKDNTIVISFRFSLGNPVKIKLF